VVGARGQGGRLGDMGTGNIDRVLGRQLEALGCGKIVPDVSKVAFSDL